MSSLYCLALSVVASLPASQDTAPTWHALTAPDRSFSVRFPGRPTRRQKRLKTPLGILHVQVYLVKPQAGQPGWFVSWSELRNNKAAVLKVPDRLGRATQAALKSTTGTLMSQKHITNDGHAGRELLVVTKNGHYLRMRLFVVDNRLYQIFLVGSRDQVSGRMARRFFNSFRLRSRPVY